jgi:sucrose-6-phosphate hydrolase SacC (GH32 family)
MGKSLIIDTTRASLDPDVWRPFPIIRGKTEPQDVPVQVAPFDLSPDERLKLRVFLDRSILEVFANGRQCLTQRIYPTRSDSLGVMLFSRKGQSMIHSLAAWDLEES